MDLADLNPDELDLSSLAEEELEELDLLLAADEREVFETDLAAFIREAWRVLEPGRPLVWSWHYDYMAEWLTLIKSGEFKKRYPEKQGIIFNVPPRTGKSKFVTVGFPVQDWATCPERRFLCASYSAQLSTEHNKYRRDLIRSDFFQAHWSGEFKFSADQNLKTKFENDHHGQQIATSVGGTATGTGGDILIVDDPLNPEQAASDVERVKANKWFDETLRSRLNDPASGVIIVVMQRLHEDDLTGHLMATEPDGWIHISIPLMCEGTKQADGSLAAERYVFPISGHVHVREVGDVLQPERFTPEVITRLQLRKMVFAGQYQQRPAPAEGNILKRNWIRHYGGRNSRPLPEKFDRVLISVDCTFKDPDQAKAGADLDYVAALVVGTAGPDRYALDLEQARMGAPETVATVLSLRKKWAHLNVDMETVIEDAANGAVVSRELKKKIPGVIVQPPDGGKTARFFAASLSWESGNWYVPEETDPAHPWVVGFIHHLVTFPNATHDDDCDAMSQADARLNKGGAGGLLDWLDQQTQRGAADREAIERANNEVGKFTERSMADLDKERRQQHE